MRRLLLLGLISACSATASPGIRPVDATPTGGSADAPMPDATRCATRISYGGAWLAPAAHPTRYDDVGGPVTWDGQCRDDGANSYATLSNGFKPYFAGQSACVIGLDANAACGAAPACTTRVRYGSGWLAPADHPTTYDDVPGRVYGDGSCTGSATTLSNGLEPRFSGTTCPLSFEYTQCGGLYNNPVIPVDCPDPGVIRDGARYVLTCTSGDAAPAFPIYTSPDLATWTAAGHVFPAGGRPVWATGDYWAPEIHQVGMHYVVYFSARDADGMLSIGAASGPTALGPFTDLGAPLIHDPAMGVIDASEFTDVDQTPYVLWKEDGNAIGKPTPIHAQRLAPNGLSVVGAPATLITNDQPWEGAVTEGPFMTVHDGMYYLFYSGNSYADASYAVGVARGSSPLAAMTKPAAPIVATDARWVGPGHCSVVPTAAGDTALVYHAWRHGCVNADGCGRDVLVDLVAWDSDGWPRVPLAPSSTPRPLP